MSHQSLMAVWSQLEKRTDLATTLRDAFGQYAAHCAACGEDPISHDSLQAFNRLINIINVAFHLQRIYLQPQQPSSNIQLYLLETDVVVEILVTLLTIKNKFLSNRKDVCAVRETALRSIGAVVLAGLRLLTIHRTKVVFAKQPDWVSTVDLIQSKLANWPLDSSLQRFLVGEIYIKLVEELVTPASPPSSHNSNVACEHHELQPGTMDALNLPSFEDGLYPLNLESRDVLTKVTKCIERGCPFWFQSFCIWYDLWSALIAASLELYSHLKKVNTDVPYIPADRTTESQAADSVLDFYTHFIQEAVNCKSANDSSRFGVILKTFFTLHPFPQCTTHECACFGYRLQHQYQQVSILFPEVPNPTSRACKLQFPGIWQPSTGGIINLHHQIALDLERRKESLRDADGHVNQIGDDLQISIRRWTNFPEEATLNLGQIKTYVVNCPELHPLTSLTLGKVFKDRGQGHAIKNIEESAPQIQVHGIPCPWCESLPFTQTQLIVFTQARLIEPLDLLDQKLKAASHFHQDTEVQHMTTRQSVENPQRIAAPSNSLYSTSSRLLPRLIRSAMGHHSRKGSSDDTSQNSSKGKSSSKYKSGSSTPSVHVNYTMFTDGKFVLVFTSYRISCYDCELMSWSRGHSFMRILMAAGSSGRYAVLSKETDAYKLSVFRRNSILEEEEWSLNLKEPPLSLAVPQQGDKVAVGFISGIQIFDGAAGSCSAALQPAMPRAHRDNSNVGKSQSMSFSVCGNDLVVATREAHEGRVFTGIYDLRPPKPRGEPMPEFKIPSVCIPPPVVVAGTTHFHTTKLVTQNYSRDLGLSSTVYEPRSSTICICSSTAQGKTLLINRVTKTNTTITDAAFRPFPGDQIQCATIVPGRVPQIVMVNDRNKVFILRYKDSRWKPFQVNVKLDSARKEVISADEKMSIAAMDGQVRLFWIQGQEGRLLTIDPDGVDDSRQFESEPVPNYAAALG